MLLVADTGATFAIFVAYRTVMLAADNGTTVAIILAFITLVGTLTANFVAWHKIRADSRNASQELTQQREKSNVEVAQAVMAQTVTTLNERLAQESDEYEKEIQRLRETNAYEARVLKHRYERDYARLEQKVEGLIKDYEACQRTNRELRVEITRLQQRGGNSRGR